MALCEFFDPARIVLTEGSNRKDVLWAAEQVLRSKGAGLTVIQLAIGPDLIESRRLQLAAEQGGGLGLVLIEGRAQSSAAQTRWHCQALPNVKTANPKAANDSAKWMWELTKNKSGNIGRWVVNCPKIRGGPHGATRDVHMVAATAA
jgi:protein ImuA